MATSLHQQLKAHYIDDEQQHEVVVDGYRIDAVDEQGRLIEIQCATLSSIRDKIRTLLKSHDVIVAKPLAARKRISTKKRRNGKIVSSRYSPTRQKLSWLFLELVHFMTVFPHPRLRLDILMTEQEEIRVPPTSRSSWRKKYSVQDRLLTELQEQICLSTPTDLWNALRLDERLLSHHPDGFTTAELAECADMPRWLAQKAAYCFRAMGMLNPAGKQGNSVVYEYTGMPIERAA
ncbi:MAG: hypothetical protein KDA96_17220 [Planctomycetaceae bacterium]|nr:hypothetical protein [Planctomycetaceae bacterium]